MCEAWFALTEGRRAELLVVPSGDGFAGSGYLMCSEEQVRCR